MLTFCGSLCFSKSQDNSFSCQKYKFKSGYLKQAPPVTTSSHPNATICWPPCICLTLCFSLEFRCMTVPFKLWLKGKDTGKHVVVLFQNREYQRWNVLRIYNTQNYILPRWNIIPAKVLELLRKMFSLGFSLFVMVAMHPSVNCWTTGRECKLQGFFLK